jgi:hypothetical protein
VASQYHVPVALDQGERSGTHCSTVWLEPRTFPDGCLEEKNSSLTGVRTHNLQFIGSRMKMMIIIKIIIIIIIKKEAEKILEYRDLTIEIQRKWYVKTKVIPVIIGATGTISKSFRKYVSNIPGNHEVKELQETAILGTAHILGKC